MLVFKNKTDIKIEYPMHTIDDPEKILYFDIETTGFSRKYCCVYLIGCMYISGENVMYAQWLAENFNDEANVLMAFHRFLQNYETLIHFNGGSFDMPFLQERGLKYKLDFNFEKYNSVDIYKPLSRLNHILKMENGKQKTFEKLLNIQRTDPFSGGDLIEVFKAYVESKDDKLIFPLLLHNQEDVVNMGRLTSLLALDDFFKNKYTIKGYKFNDFKDINDEISKELVIDFLLDTAMPISISYNFNGIYLKLKDETGSISIRVKKGTYKFFFDNYKDYYFLPLEDRAIHKSLASFVNKDYRENAKATNCYEKHSGEFLPVFNNSFDNLLKENYNDKNGMIFTKSINDDSINKYLENIISFLSKKTK